MRSIRFSLIVYFLGLLALALGAVFLLVYRTTAQALQEKQETNRQLLLAQYEARRRDEITKLDNDLLLHARNLANVAQSQFEWDRLYGLRILPLGLLNASLSPNAHALAPLWVGELLDHRVYNMIAGAQANEVRLNEDQLPKNDDRSTDLCQVNLTRGRPWRSKSLGERTLPFEENEFQQMKMFDWEFDDIELNGAKLRRVRLKSPVVRSKVFPPSMPLPPRGGRGFRGMPQPGPVVQVRDAMPFFIQWATDRGERDAALAELDVSMREQLRAADDEARDSLAELRKQLAWIGVATFAAVCVGASILVRVGLSPLRRLGDAVSRVSASDFKLKFEGPKPPAELVPIVERMQTTLAMLQRAFDREKQATADISHELRTPLAALMTTVDVALRKPRATDEYRRSIQDCKDIIRQMSQMVERMLALSWLDSHSDVVRAETVDAAELADQCATIIRPLAEASGLTLRIRKDASLKVRTDVSKVREIISNLLHNAVEYNRPGGSIDLNVQTTEAGLDVAVSDTGIGVAAEHQDKIFERFFRADASRQATGLHAGLGLSIVRGYVSLLGGTISLESEVGRGSTFRVQVPSATSA